MSKITNAGKKCPNCGAEGKCEDEHETAIRNVKLGSVTIVDVGWRCWKCGNEWGFEAGQEGFGNGTEGKESQMSEVSQEDINAAVARYPGVPIPLAITKYMVDQHMERQETPPLNVGVSWGGIHLESVGILVQKLANAMYEQRKRGITITIQATDFPESWDHILIDVKDVDSGAPEELERMGLAGYPCCACDEVIKGDDTHSTAVILEKRAKWKYPTWGNVLYGTEGMAVAALCGKCVGEERQPLFAIKKEDGAEDIENQRFVRVPLSELEDAPSV